MTMETMHKFLWSDVWFAWDCFHLIWWNQSLLGWSRSCCGDGTIGKMQQGLCDSSGRLSIFQEVHPGVHSCFTTTKGLIFETVFLMQDTAEASFCCQVYFVVVRTRMICPELWSPRGQWLGRHWSDVWWLNRDLYIYILCIHHSTSRTGCMYNFEWSKIFSKGLT